MTDNSQHKYNNIQPFQEKTFETIVSVLNKALKRNDRKLSCPNPQIKERALEDVSNLLSATRSLFISMVIFN